MHFQNIPGARRGAVYTMREITEHRPLFAHLQAAWQPNVEPALPPGHDTGLYVMLPSLCVYVGLNGGKGGRVVPYPVIVLGISPTTAMWQGAVDDMLTTLWLHRIYAHRTMPAARVVDPAMLTPTALREFRRVQQVVLRIQQHGYEHANVGETAR